MHSRWGSFGERLVSLAIHRDPTPLDAPTSYAILDKGDLACKIPCENGYLVEVG